MDIRPHTDSNARRAIENQMNRTIETKWQSSMLHFSFRLKSTRIQNQENEIDSTVTRKTIFTCILILIVGKNGII